MSRINRPPSRIFGRLNLEHLEARDVPAAYYWSPTTPQMLTSQADNWLVGPGTPYAPATEAPNSDDHLYFGWDVEGDEDAYVGPASGAIPVDPPPPTVDTFAGVHLLAGYTQRVTFLTSVRVGDFSIASGAIRQADTQLIPGGLGGAPPPPGSSGTQSVTSLTVTSEFGWTGGTINDGDLLGDLILAPGAVGVAEPTNAGTVTLGSDITLGGDEDTDTGSTLDFSPGTFNLLLDAGVIVESHSHCRHLLKLGQAVVVKKGANDLVFEEKGTYTVKQGGTLSFILDPETPRPANNTELAVYDGTQDDGVSIRSEGGDVKLSNLVKVKLGGELTYDINGDEYTATVLQTGDAQAGVGAGDLSIESGSHIVTKSGVAAYGGNIFITARKNGGQALPLADQPSAVIETTTANGTALRLSGTAKLDFIDNPAFRTLEIDGKFDWWGQGTVVVRIDSGATTDADFIHVTGDVSVGDNAKVETSGQFDPAMRNRQNGTTWRFLTSGGTISQAPDSPPPNGAVVNFDVTLDQPQQELRLKKLGNL
jgi:hypothetical protein